MTSSVYTPTTCHGSLILICPPVLSLVWGQAVCTWKVEAVPFQEFAFAQPMTLHNRGTESFQKRSLNSRSLQPRLSPACHPSIPQSRAKHPAPRKMSTHASQSFLRGRFTLSNKALTSASFGRSHLQEELLLWPPSNILTGSAGSHETLAFVSLTCLPAHGFYLCQLHPPPCLSQCCLRAGLTKEKQDDV